MPPAKVCGNPILLGFVREWLEQARERNSKGVIVYKKAYDSLKECPLQFKHPSEAKQLTGFGDKLCQRLTERMNEYCEAEGLPLPERVTKGRKKSATDQDGDGEDAEEPAPKRVRKAKPYVPTLRSGAYAIVMALSTLGEDHLGICKEDLVKLAQPYSDTSFTAPAQANKFYTAWNSVKTLEEKDIVHSRGRPKRYRLLDEGWEVARRMKAAQTSARGSATMTASIQTGDLPSPGESASRPSVPHAVDVAFVPAPVADFIDIPVGEVVTSEAALPSFVPITFPVGSFTVELIVDNREVRTQKDRDYIQNSLSERQTNVITRALPLGDVLWIAKITDPVLKEQHGGEVLLDYIIERKRLDDLIGSIKDGRFHDQKFRLQKSGVKNIIYIIEEFSMNADHYQKYDEAVKSAIASMQVVNGFFVKKTLQMDDTIRYLVSMTKMMKQRYENKPLSLIPTNVITSQNHLPLLQHLKVKSPSTEYHITYPVFASLSNKSESFTLRDIFLKMLMCTRGVTGEKALEIQKRWKTPIEFSEAFKSLETGKTPEEARKRKAEMVSAEMGALVGRKKIAKTLSVKIAEIWGNEEY